MFSVCVLSLFFFQCYRDHRDLHVLTHSFPTRRSSDLKIRRSEPDPHSGIERHVDLGFVGEPVAVDPTILSNLAGDNFIPIVAPVALGADGATYKIGRATRLNSSH